MAQLQSACRHGSIRQPPAAVQTQRPQCFAVQRNSHHAHVLHLQDILQCLTPRRRDQTCVQFVRLALHVIRKSRAAEFKCAQSADTDHLPQGTTAQHALEWAGKQQCALARSMKCACLDAAAQVQDLQLPAAPRQALHALLCDPLTPAQIHTPQLPAPMEISFSITASTHFKPCMLLLGTSANVLAYDCKV